MIGSAKPGIGLGGLAERCRFEGRKMQTGIVLAGGKSERFGGASALPKPAVPLQGTPMVLHAAAALARAGCQRIIVLTGANHGRLREALKMSGDDGDLLLEGLPPIPLTLRYSGDDSGTGGRLNYVQRAEISEGALISYTDVFADFDLTALSDLRVERRVTMALLAVNPRQPWGKLELQDDDTVIGFHEKPVDPNTWVNGGFFAVGPALHDAIHADHEDLEREVIGRLVAERMIVVARHRGWWASVNSAKELRQMVESTSFQSLARPSVK